MKKRLRQSLRALAPMCQYCKSEQRVAPSLRAKRSNLKMGIASAQTNRLAMTSYLRIVDANYNRAKEAIRVVEDFSRFFLNDASLTSQFKRARHQLTQVLLTFPLPYRDLVEARDSRNDVGRRGSLKDRSGRPSWKDLMLANLKRSEEALRVLEEISKAVHPKSSSRFQALRFRIYELEKICLRKI